MEKDSRRRSSKSSPQRLNSYFVYRTVAIYASVASANSIRDLNYSQDQHPVSLNRDIWGRGEGRHEQQRDGIQFDSLRLLPIRCKELWWGYIREWALPMYHVSSITGWWKAVTQQNNTSRTSKVWWSGQQLTLIGGQNGFAAAYYIQPVCRSL